MPELYVAALDPDEPYRARLSARSALYTELQLLLDAAPGLLEGDQYRSLVLGQNALRRASMSARAKLWKELKTRYLLTADEELFRMFWMQWQRCTSEQERALLAYLLLALHDRLVFDLGQDWLFTKLRFAPQEMRVADVEAFMERAVRAHPEVGAWSVQTRLAVAQKYLASIRDFGLAEGKARKLSVRPALYAAPVRFMIDVLRAKGLDAIELIRSPVFRLLALEQHEVVDALSELHQDGALFFRMQADVIQLSTKAGA